MNSDPLAFVARVLASHAEAKAARAVRDATAVSPCFVNCGQPACQTLGCVHVYNAEHGQSDELDERCGAWVTVGGYESDCMRPIDHPGDCLPLRSECMDAADRSEREAAWIHDAVTAIDAAGGWPFEGISDER